MSRTGSSSRSTAAFARRGFAAGRNRGGAIIELALTFTVITSLTFGLVEFGYYFRVKNIFRHPRPLAESTPCVAKAN